MGKAVQIRALNLYIENQLAKVRQIQVFSRKPLRRSSQHKPERQWRTKVKLRKGTNTEFSQWQGE